MLVEPLPPTIIEVVSMQEIVERRREKALARVIPTSSSSSGVTLTPTIEVDTTSPLRLSELEAEEQMMYSMNVRLYERAIKQYDRKAAAMRKMCSRIQETVAPAYQYILYDKDTALEMMLAVKTQFKPTTIATARHWESQSRMRS